MPAPPASSRQAPNDSISCPARIDPIHAPRLLPTPISGNRRLPCSSVKRSAANAQNCAITITLKMPGLFFSMAWKVENGYMEVVPGSGNVRQQKQQQVRREEQRHPLDQLHAVYARRERAVRRDDREQQHRLPGRRVALHLGAAFAEDEHLARGLEQVIRGEHEKHRQHHHQCGRGLAAAHVGDRREQALDESLVGRRLRGIGDDRRQGGHHRSCVALSVAPVSRASSASRSRPTRLQPPAVRRK